MLLEAPVSHTPGTVNIPLSNLQVMEFSLKTSAQEPIIQFWPHFLLFMVRISNGLSLILHEDPASKR